MKRKLLFCYTFFLFYISFYAVDLTSLDKYTWIEQVPNTRGGYTSFIKLALNSSFQFRFRFQTALKNVG